jgi:hypothetical protein
VNIAASLAEFFEFVIQGLPVTGQHMISGDHHIYFTSAGLYRLLDFLNTLRKWGLSCREPCRDRGNGDSRALQSMDGIGYTIRIDTHRANRYRVFTKPEPIKHIWSDWLSSFGAKALNTTWGIITAEGGQVDTGDGA